MPKIFYESFKSNALLGVRTSVTSGDPRFTAKDGADTDNLPISPCCAKAQNIVNIPSFLEGETQWRPDDVGYWLRNPPPPMEYLFTHIFPENTVAGLCGAGGSGKSFAALQLAYSLASGTIVFPSFPPVEPRRVMVLMGEDAKTTIWNRLSNIHGVFPLSAEREKTLRQNLFLYSRRAEPLCYKAPGGRVEPTEAYHSLQREVCQKRPALLIIDPKSRWSGVSENSNDGATAFVKLIEALVRPHGASALITHHVSKSGSKSLDASGARGASAFVDGLRLVFNMAHYTSIDKQTNIIKHRHDLTISKTNVTCRPQHNITFTPSLDAQGVLIEMDDHAWETQLHLFALCLSDWLKTHGPINMSAIRAPRDNRAKGLRTFMEERGCTSLDLMDEAIKYGEENFILIVETVATKGRPAKQIRMPTDEELMAHLESLRKTDTNPG